VLNFDLDTEREGDSALVSIRGDFDLQVAERVARALAEVEATEPELLVIDLSRLSFLDSTGMGVIAAFHARTIDANRRFVIVRPPGGIRQAFEVSGLDEVVTITDDVASVYPP
jgi:anti-sigma B factor antagonist